jgi:hypothetical protein
MAASSHLVVTTGMRRVWRWNRQRSWAGYEYSAVCVPVLVARDHDAAAKRDCQHEKDEDKYERFHFQYSFLALRCFGLGRACCFIALFFLASGCASRFGRLRYSRLYLFKAVKAEIVTNFPGVKLMPGSPPLCLMCVAGYLTAGAPAGSRIPSRQGIWP